MPWVAVGLLPTAGIVWIVATRHRRGVLEAASWLAIIGAVIFALEHGIFATTCAVEVWCPVKGTRFADDHVRLHVFMAGVYTFLGAGALIVVARTLLRTGRRSGWFTLLAALGVGGTLEVVAASAWFAHGLTEDVTPLGDTFEDLSFLFLYTYLLAWIAALIVSYRAVFGQDGAS